MDDPVGDGDGRSPVERDDDFDVGERAAKVLVVGGRRLVRSTLRRLVISLIPSVEVFEAVDLAAVAAVTAAHGDLSLVVLDRLAGDAPVPVRALADAVGEVPLVVLCAEGPPEFLAALLRDGARGVVPDSFTCEVMLEALRLVAAGGVFVPPAVLGSPAQEGWGAAPSGRGLETKAALTPRQLEVLRCAADGLSNKLIAQRLYLSPATVKNHMAAIISALGARNRTDAIRIAARQRLITL